LFAKIQVGWGWGTHIIGSLGKEVVRYLLEMRADQNKVNQRGAPPIHMAAMSGHLTDGAVVG